jgi:hypothetical protein
VGAVAIAPPHVAVVLRVRCALQVITGPAAAAEVLGALVLATETHTVLPGRECRRRCHTCVDSSPPVESELQCSSASMHRPPNECVETLCQPPLHCLTHISMRML